MSKSPLRRFLWPVAAVGIALSVAPLGCSVLGIRTTEEPDYVSLMQEGDFELREYPAIVVAETTVPGGFDDAGNEAFGRLFGYISGANRGEQSLAMTAPVMAAQGGDAQDSGELGRELSSAAPRMGVQGDDGSWTFSFVLPADQTLQTAPRPTNPKVKLREIPGRRVAVLRGSGSWSEAQLRDRSAELQVWIEEQGWRAGSRCSYAGYDPPWTLPFLRRNEVLVEVRAEAATRGGGEWTEEPASGAGLRSSEVGQEGQRGSVVRRDGSQRLAGLVAKL